jgi:hypothetical protein
MGQPISQAVTAQHRQDFPPPIQIAVQLWDCGDFHDGRKIEKRVRA